MFCNFANLQESAYYNECLSYKLLKVFFSRKMPYIQTNVKIRLRSFYLKRETLYSPVQYVQNIKYHFCIEEDHFIPGVIT